MKNNSLPNHSESFWHMTSSVDKYPKLDKDLDVEVAVIGGGIAGILSAYELNKRGKKVALVEAREMLYGTTGFTTAKLSSQHNLIYNKLIKAYGEEKARKYFDANMEGINIIREISEKYKIECELKEQDSYVYTIHKEKLEDLREEALAYQSLSIDGELVEDLPVNLGIQGGLVMHRQYEFHPVMFLSGLLKELEKSGVLIFEHTMIKEVNDGDRVSLKTEDDKTISCDQAICASHYPVDDPDEFYTENMEPGMSLVSVYKYDGEYPGGMYISNSTPSRTFRLVEAEGKQYILVGGEDHPIGSGTSDLERYDILRGFAKDVFKAENLLAYWSAHDYLTKDRVPFVGLSGPDRKNVYLVTGLNKWGLSNSAISSKILADAIEGKENKYKEIYDPNRDIPDMDDESDKEEKRKSSTPKDQVGNLNEGEALTYEEDETKFGIFKDEKGELHYLDLTCTHLGCDLAWNDGDKTWDCPCHGSRFDALGKVIEGPAMEPLRNADKEKRG